LLSGTTPWPVMFKPLKNADRPGKVQGRRRAGHDGLRVAQVRLKEIRLSLRAAGQQRLDALRALR